MRIDIIIPVYNSENTIEELVNKLAMTDLNYHLYLVDDNSLDNSAKIIRGLVSNQVTGILLKRNYGQQNAIKAAFEYTKGDYVVTMDDDLQQDPNDIKLLLANLKEFDVIYGSYLKKQSNHFRIFGSNLTDLFFNLRYKKVKEVKVSSFRLMKREVVEKIKLDQTPFVYLTAIILKNSFKITSIKVKHYPSKRAKSNYSFVKLIKLYFKLFYYYTIYRGKQQSQQYEIKEVIKWN